MSILGFWVVSAQSVLPDTPYDLFGYACNPSDAVIIGCISLNKLSSAGQSGFANQPTTPWRVTYNPAQGKLEGKGWNPTVGEVEFGIQCPTSINSFIPGASNGYKCAKITNIATGNPEEWKGYIYTGSVTYVPASTGGNPTGAMSGYAWEAWNVDGATAPYSPEIGIGRLDFNQYAFIQIPGCMDPSASNYNPYATQQDTSCSSTVEICTDVIDNNGNSTINEGCPEICGDGLDNDQNSQTDENPPCSGSGGGGGGGGGTGTGIGTIKYKER